MHVYTHFAGTSQSSQSSIILLCNASTPNQSQRQYNQPLALKRFWSLLPGSCSFPIYRHRSGFCLLRGQVCVLHILRAALICAARRTFKIWTWRLQDLYWGRNSSPCLLACCLWMSELQEPVLNRQGLARLVSLPMWLMSPTVAHWMCTSLKHLMRSTKAHPLIKAVLHNCNCTALH